MVVLGTEEEQKGHLVRTKGLDELYYVVWSQITKKFLEFQVTLSVPKKSTEVQVQFIIMRTEFNLYKKDVVFTMF